MIELHGVEKSYGKGPVLKGVDLEVARGEFIAVSGSSGSGKSTLLNLIGGMDRPEKGTITVEGAEISSYPDDALTRYRKHAIGFVFQFFNLLPNISIFENVRIPLLLNGITETEGVFRFLARVGLEGKEPRYPHELSGGEQQRVAIARALVHEPAIVLADEPTGSLDSRTGEAVMELMKQLIREEAKTIVLVTHEAYVSRHADRIVRIKDGLISS